MSENKRCTISVPQLPDESFVTNRRIYLFCAGICEKCKPRNEGCPIFQRNQSDLCSACVAERNQPPLLRTIPYHRAVFSLFLLDSLFPFQQGLTKLPVGFFETGPSHDKTLGIVSVVRIVGNQSESVHA